jgi:hypothetical protein
MSHSRGFGLGVANYGFFGHKSAIRHTQVYRAVPRVRIHPAPPWSPSLFAIQRQTIEIRAIAGDFAELVAAENAPNRGFRRFAARLICINGIRGHDEMRPTTRRR